MTLIDGDKIVTAQLYDDEYEEFTEKNMSIIEFVNAYSDEGVTITNDVLDKIRSEIENTEIVGHIKDVECFNAGINVALNVIDKYKTESEGNRQ